MIKSHNVPYVQWHAEGFSNGGRGVAAEFTDWLLNASELPINDS